MVEVTEAQGMAAGQIKNRIVAHLMRANPLLAPPRSRMSLSDAVSARALLKTLADRDEVLEQLGELLSDCCRSRDSLLTMLVERDGALAELAEALGERDRRIQELGAMRRKQADRSIESEVVAHDLLEEINHSLCSFVGLRKARQLLLDHYRNEDDPNLSELLAAYDHALVEGLPYWDIRTAVRVASAVLRPATYLEVGTRRGWSLAQVIAECPTVHAYVFDQWVEGYGGAAQGSPEYVRAKIAEVAGAAGQPRIEFISGNSHDTLPEFFGGRLELPSGQLPDHFDLVTVDGDHTRLGAWWDLSDLFPRVRIGGALLFDDLDYVGDEADGARARSQLPRPELPPQCRSLRDVWLWMQSHYPNFIFLNAGQRRFQAGIAVRVW